MRIGFFQQGGRRLPQMSSRDDVRWRKDGLCRLPSWLYQPSGKRFLPVCEVWSGLSHHHHEYVCVHGMPPRNRRASDREHGQRSRMSQM